MGQYGKFTNSFESFRTVEKVSGHSGKVLDSLESFWTVDKISGQSGKFLENHVICCSVFRQFGTIYTLLNVMKMIYALLAPMSQKNLRISSGKFLRVKVCRP